MTKQYEIADMLLFKQKALQYACNTAYVFLLENCFVPYKFDAFPQALAFGAKRIFQPDKNTFEQLKEFHSNAERNIYGFLSYDLKNETENLQSQNPDNIDFPNTCFIEPETELFFDENTVTIHSSSIPPDTIFSAINSQSPILNSQFSIPNSQSRYTKTEYIETIRQIQHYITMGDIYEMNFCMEFFSEQAKIDPISTFFRLTAVSPMPFSTFVKWNDKYLLCASPERFLKKQSDLIISQPIKGTVKRGTTPEEDESLKAKLSQSEKERAENVMIVDLVRNDLSHTSRDGTVKVEELFGIYTFEQVHQMISTVTALLDEKKHFTEAIKNAFPMGSMTGAPKIRAMELIEKIEKTKRGLFSGSVGYITPNSDFDFNVVIRSILYNQDNQYLSFQAGSAITIDSEPEKEWEECLVKTKAIRDVLGLSDQANS